MVKCQLIAAVASVFVATQGAVAADAYPARPIQIVVSTTPGSSPDTIARLLANGLGTSVGQPVVVENRGGANGRIAVEEVARAKPDGYTLLVTTGATLSTNPFLYPKSGGKTVLKLKPVTQIASSDFILAAHPSAGVSTFDEFVRRVRDQPGKLDLATTAQGSFAYLIAQSLKQAAGVDFLTVPYNGGGPAMTAFIGGQTHFYIDVATLLAPLIESGKAIGLATTGARRSPVLPDLPTMAESGVPDMDVTGWFGLMAPPGTPDAVIDYLYGKIAAIAGGAEFRKRLSVIHAVPIASSPQDFGATLAKEQRKWAQVIEESGIETE